MHEHDRNNHACTLSLVRWMTDSRTSATLSLRVSDAPIMSTSAATAPAFVVKTSQLPS